jgi:hypothetical protein
VVCGCCEQPLQCLLYPADWVCDARLLSPHRLFSTRNLLQSLAVSHGEGEGKTDCLEDLKKLQCSMR